MVQERGNGGSEDDKRSYLEYILKMNWNSGYILEVEPTKLADRMELGYERKHRTKEEKQRRPKQGILYLCCEMFKTQPSF